MSTTTPAKERILPTPAYQARWKHHGGEELDETWRALCGRQGCGGCLGYFYYFSIERILAKLRDEHRFIEARVAELRAQGVDESSSELFVLSSKFAPLLRDRLRGFERVLALAGPDDDPYLRRWVMSPRPSFADGLEQSITGSFKRHESDEAGIYRGYHDTGYFIQADKKSKRAQTRFQYAVSRSRRPFVPRSPAEAALYRLDRRRNWTLSAQAPVPPTRIWCPHCESLNAVAPPPGFVATDGGCERGTGML